MKLIIKYSLLVLFWVGSIHITFAQCWFSSLTSELSDGTENFKSFVKNNESSYKSYQLLYTEAPELKTDITELTLVANNLEKIEDVGGYIKWKDINNAGGDLIRGVSKTAFRSSFEASEIIKDKAWKLFADEDWKGLEKLFKDNNLNGRWPPNDGFIDILESPLSIGTKIDRYGGFIDNETGLFKDTGKFLANDGEPFTNRALQASSKERIYSQYEVIKEIPKVKTGKAIPWFGEKGKGVQYLLDNDVDYYVRKGFLKRVSVKANSKFDKLMFSFKDNYPKSWKYKKVGDGFEVTNASGKKLGTIYKDKIVASGRKVKGEAGNPLLNKVPLEKNVIYEVDGFSYKTDDLGRVIETNADLDDIARIRLGNQQIRAVDIKDGVSGSDQGGHIVASRFFGPGEQINMYPQSASLNQGAWKQMENTWATEMINGKDVKIKVNAIFEGSSKRPSKFKVQYTIDGQPFSRSFDN